MLWNGILCNLCTYPILFFDGNSKIFFLGEIDSTIVCYWVVLSLTSLVGLWFSLASYQLLDPTICSVFQAQEVVFAYIIQAIALNFVSCFISFIGASLVVLSAVFISLETFFVPKLPTFCWNTCCKKCPMRTKEN